MKSPDQMRRFIFEHSPIRGQHVSLDQSWQKIVAQSDAKGLALTLLGQALTAVSLLVETLKIDGSVTLQIRGSGAIHLLVAEATSKHTIRGLVRQTRELEDEQSLQEIFAADKLVITINNRLAKPHQGIVPLSGNDLSSALQAYFDQSEQLPTRFWFSCNSDSATGMLLQKLPAEMPDDDAWNRILHLASSTTQQELLQLETEILLTRLFHQEELRLFDATPIEFACSCSAQRTRDMLVSLGKAEIDSIIEEQQEITITCEFCNSTYYFDKVDLGQLMATEAVTLSSTKH